MKAPLDKPKTFSVADLATLPPALKSLTKQKRWVVWRWTWNGTKWDKPPSQSRNPQRNAASNQPATWSSYAAAVKAVQDGNADGIGYVLTKGKVAAADLDDCRDPVSGKLTPWAEQWVAEAQATGVYVETTVSGTGLRGIGTTTSGEKLGTKLRLEDGGSIELYRGAVRYITISGLQHGTSRKLPNIDALLDRTHQRYKREHKSADGKFSGIYPPAERKEIQAALDAMSSDDYMIWFEVGCGLHKEFGEDGFELFEQWSKKSDKYDKHQCQKKWRECKKITKYTAGTIFHYADEANPNWRDKIKSNKNASAKRLTKDEVRRAKQVAVNIEIGDDVTEPIVPTIMTLAEMLDRLIFVGSSGVIVDRANGRIRKKEIAGSEYAASRHSHKGMDVPALRMWLASPHRISVDVLSWVPGAAQICPPPEAVDGARTAFNTWRGLSPMPEPPNDWKKRAKPFLEHVDYLVPIKSECKRFLLWLAHILQRPEVMPHTCYLMITKTTGIGRNLLASVLVRVLRGHAAAGVSLPELLDGGFNGRLSRKLLATVDEVREGHSNLRYQRSEKLKSLITEERRHINIKYGTQSVEKNCCRWLMFSNHHDAVPFDNTDRRVIVIDNPTERKPAKYYERMFALLDNHNFITSVRKLLLTMDISDFHAGEHAPMNEAKMQAIHWMRSDIERAVVEFKNECTTELTSREKIRDYVNDYCGHNVLINENHLTHAIAGAGMINARRRIKEKITTDPKNIVERRHTVVIVKGKWTVETVEVASVKTLLKALQPK
jgi:primase-polymerase (primpol)-like protein